MRELIRKTRSFTDRPFGVGVVLAFPHRENIKAILSEKVAVLQVYWGECLKELVIEAHSAGVKVVPQVSIVFFSTIHIDRDIFAIINIQEYTCEGLFFIIQEGTRRLP